MVGDIAKYLGKPIDMLRDAAPFSNWPVRILVETELGERTTDYLYFENGIDVRCDSNERIAVIFLFSEESGGLKWPSSDVSFAWRREQVVEYFGAPSACGKAFNDPILGRYGPWDRFQMLGHVCHFEYWADKDCIKMVTLMRDDFAP